MTNTPSIPIAFWVLIVIILVFIACLIVAFVEGIWEQFKKERAQKELEREWRKRIH